ncbi:uncharacterized protein LOC113170391 isoform X2 [Anabas testudineus]|uniref:uncharacterized protein LOC113170391 isoform X2 n=1 Tax=Anabas testudineus TaxID=64144 RepID=UPI000E45876B|nr:uncharacterized protein LOC113170391 isoform X2 [Anabas testudineus]
MGRNKWRVCRETGLHQKRDTPVKPALGRREKHRRLLPSRNHEALPEEPEVEELLVPTGTTISPVWTSIKPVHCKSVLHLSRPGFTENPRDTAVSPATRANKKSACQVSSACHPPIQMAPDPEAIRGGEIVVKEDEQNLAVAQTSVTSSGMESDTTFSSDDDDEECYSSCCSSLPSPEIFRRENDAETVNTELWCLHTNMKNSTLLDVSQAQSIHMHQPPNLSAIIDASTILAEKCEIRGPEAETQIQSDSFKSDKEKKGKTPDELTKKRPILCKKVVFKSPIAEISPVQIFSRADQMKPEQTARAVKNNSNDDTLHLKVTLKRPGKRSPEKAKFFDFVTDNDRDLFFQMMRERCNKLRSAPLLPLTAAKHTVASVL